MMQKVHFRLSVAQKRCCLRSNVLLTIIHGGEYLSGLLNINQFGPNVHHTS